MSCWCALSCSTPSRIRCFTSPSRIASAMARTLNDCGAFAGPCPIDDTQANVLTHGFLPSDRGYYHGGDLAGLRSKLDYLHEMGVTAVWVGPVFKNKTGPDRTSSNLYGYSVRLSRLLDPGFPAG